MRLPVILVACVALAVPAGCGDDDEGGGGGGAADKPEAPAKKEASGGGSAVSMKGIAFDPAELSVKAGTTVTWTNDEAVAHDVTSTGGPSKFSSGESGGMQKGDTFKTKLTKPGTYDYVCTVHSNMKGSVTVQ